MNSMNNLIKFLGIACSVALFCACGNKQVEQSGGYEQFEQPDTTNMVQRMKDYYYTDSIVNGNNHFVYDITRKADDTMPVIKNDDKELFADNYICLKVNKNGKEIFNKTFTKNTFKAYLSQTFYEESILEGMAFNKTEGQNIHFIASVSYPNTDLFTLFTIIIAPDGTYIIKEEDNLEMNEE